MIDRLRHLRWVHFNTEQGGGGDGGTGDAAAPAAGDTGGDSAADAAPAQDGAVGAEQAGSEGYWPGDWRSKIAGEDEKVAKQLGRYATPAEVAKALIAAQTKIRSGQLKSSLPENPSEDELKAWREENGIPATPKDYDLTFDNGLVIGDDDRPVVDSFLEHVAHKHNLPPSVAKDAVEWWYQTQQSQLDDLAEQDLSARDKTQDELNVEWGGEYRRNINMVSGLIDQFPEGVRDQIKSARLPDGTALFNNPDVLRGFVNLALEVNPAGTLVPSGMGDPAKSINGEISEIESFMRSNRNAYFKDEAKQARYRELLEAREKLQKRAS